MHLLIATTNSGKIREFREMLSGLNIEFTDLSQHRELPVVEETGATFAENAALKATEYGRQLRMYALADDSGLEVDALGGKPGIHSARWAAMHDAGEGNAANNALLLRQMNEAPDEKRGARFVCALALADPKGNIILTAQDNVEGSILRSPRGEGGFGYDPLFLVKGMNQTTGELPAEEKHRISHRGKALRKLAQQMRGKQF